MVSTDALLHTFGDAIQRSKLGPAVLGPEWLPHGQFVKAFDPVMRDAFRTLGLRVERKQRDNPLLRAWREEHPTMPMVQQRPDYLLRRNNKLAAIAELESLDRAQVMTFKCQYYDWDSGKRDYYWATVDHLVRHPELPRLEFFLFFLVLPDFPVSPYRIWDSYYGEKYYGVYRSDHKEIFRSPYRFYDHRIKKVLRDMLRNQDPEATPDLDWSVQGRPLADLQEVCELLVVTLTGPELVLARGRDLLEPSRERRRSVLWNSPPERK